VPVGELIDDTVDERRLRAHDHQVATLTPRRHHDRSDVVGGHLEAADPVAGDAGVARSGQDLGRRRRAPQGTHERVLAPSPSDDEHPAHKLRGRR